MSDSTVRKWLLEHTPLEPTLLEGDGFDAIVAEHVATIAPGNESAYVAALGRFPDEVERLAADIAVPETWLFRYPRSFELLGEVLRRRVSAAVELRMCSIGCATGLEPYCMAMTALHSGWAPERVRIAAMDRNPEALVIASAAVYGPGSIRGELPAWAAEYLIHEEGQIRIDPRIRAMIGFARVDVTALGIEGTFDVIFCRNMMIYLNAIARMALVRAICAALSPGGVLFVGHAEQFIRGESMLRPIAAPHAFALERVETPSGVVEMTRRVSATERTVKATPVAHRPMEVPVRHREMAIHAPPRGSDLADARELADAGRMAESEQMARSFVARCGPTAAAMELLGLIRIAANDVKEAKRLFEQAVYLEPDRPACLLQLAMISERAGDPRRASMYWERARRASAAQEAQG